MDSLSGLFMFDNAPSHMKRAADAISATKMVKSASYYTSLYVFVFLSTSPQRSQASLVCITQMGLACVMASTPWTGGPQSFSDFPRQPPPLFGVVQGYGTNYP